MEVALILEGSYPYTTGGLSSWTQQLMEHLPDKRFKIVSIMPGRATLPSVKYRMPKNVVEVHTLFLEDYMLLSPHKRGRSVRLTQDEQKAVENFLAFDILTDWELAITTLSNVNKIGTSVEFLKSEYFWEYLLDRYQQDYAAKDFNRHFWSLISMYVPLLTLIQQEGPQADVYHSLSTGYAGLMGLVYKFRYGKPLILTEHGIYAREREEEIINASWVADDFKTIWIRYFYAMSTGVYKSADMVASLFNRNRDIQIELGSPSAKTVVIPNGVQVESYAERTNWDNRTNIGAILRVVHIKDVKTLIRAFKIVNSELPDTKLFIIGSGDEDLEYYLECKQLVDLLLLNGKVEFTGQVDIQTYLPLLDLLVLTSLSEGQPLVMLEGMAAGLPFVATDVGSCSELLLGQGDDSIGPAGIIVPPVSPEETAQAITVLLQDQAMRSEMGKNARLRVEKYYNQGQFIESYRQAYDRLGK